MSVIAYGYIVNQRRSMSPARFAALTTAGEADNKLITAIAALVPAEILGLHALAISWWTATDKDGNTTITQPDLLRGALVALLVVTVVGYLIGRRFAHWEGKDWIRLIMPPLALLAWMALLSTSALSPWLSALRDQSLVTQHILPFAAGLVAILLIALNHAVNPPTPA